MSTRTSSLAYYLSSCSDSLLWWSGAGVTVKVPLQVRMGGGHLSQEPLFPACTSVSPSVKVGTWNKSPPNLSTSGKKSIVSNMYNIWIYSCESSKHYRQPLQLCPTSTQPCPALGIFPTVTLVTHLLDPFSVIFPCINIKNEFIELFKILHRFSF